MSDQNCEVCGKKLTAWNRKWGTNKCSSCAKGQTPGLPLPSKGVWWWAGFIGVGLFAQILQQTRFESVVLQMLLLVPFIATLAICGWWYSESKRKQRRSVGFRLGGYLLFGFGSISPIGAFVSAVLILFSGNVNHPWEAFFQIVGCLIFGAALIGTSYFLVFEQKHKAPDKEAISASSSGILAASRDGDLEKAKALLKSNPDLVFSKDNYGYTPLHYAAVGGYKDVAELLLANKAEVNAKNNYGDTPLHRAAAGGYKEVAELLRQHGGHE